MRQPKTTLPPAVVLTLANGFIDAHTYLELGGVFANVQTANVIFFGSAGPGSSSHLSG